jgi:N-sulfoglucosamine sulfohydrolase
MIRTTAVLLFALGVMSCSDSEPDRPVNFLLITADDLEWSSVGVYGSEVENITPNIDRLASEGLRFTNAHVNVAICQPSRQSLMTGRYPHNNGAPGFQPIADDVPLLQESLRSAGYLNGSIGKTRHLQPVERFGWDLGPDADILGEGIWMHHLGNGRDINLYKQYMSEFLQLARNNERPFWLMLNTHDPHKPFYGDGGEEFDYPVSRVYTPDEIEVPGYLPDLPKVREELARYYTSVRRADDIVGAILKILEDEGFLEDTLVMFISDNGSSFPFSKANAYLNSTKTPWIIRWPGRIAPGSIDTSHFISGIDYMPTVLEVAGLAPVPNLDGESFLPLLEGDKQAWRTSVFTEINTPYSGVSIHMRAIQSADFGYIYNPFFGEENVDVEGNDGPTWDAMVEAARSNPAIKKRVDLFTSRVPDELYHYKTDPDALNNLIADPAYADVVAEMRQQLAKEMARTNDFMLEKFATLQRQQGSADRGLSTEEQLLPESEIQERCYCAGTRIVRRR